MERSTVPAPDCRWAVPEASNSGLPDSTSSRTADVEIAARNAAVASDVDRKGQRLVGNGCASRANAADGCVTGGTERCGNGMHGDAQRAQGLADCGAGLGASGKVEASIGDEDDGRRAFLGAGGDGVERGDGIAARGGGPAALGRRDEGLGSCVSEADDGQAGVGILVCQYLDCFVCRTFPGGIVAGQGHAEGAIDEDEHAGAERGVARGDPSRPQGSEPSSRGGSGAVADTSRARCLWRHSSQAMSARPTVASAMARRTPIRGRSPDRTRERTISEVPGAPAHQEGAWTWSSL